MLPLGRICIYFSFCLQNVDIGFQAIHGVLAVNYYLHKLHIIRDSGCPLCGEVETVHHLFYYCSHAQFIWKWFISFFKLKIKVSADIVVFQYLEMGTGCKNAMFQFVIAEIKCVLWISRNCAKFDRQVRSPISVLNFLKSRLKFRIRVDFYRFSRNVFQDYWVDYLPFCRLVGDDFSILDF